MLAVFTASATELGREQGQKNVSDPPLSLAAIREKRKWVSDVAGVSPHFFRQHKPEKSAGLTLAPLSRPIAGCIGADRRGVSDGSRSRGHNYRRRYLRPWASGQVPVSC